MSRRARLLGRIVSHHPVVPGNTPQNILDDILPLRRPESAHHESLWWNMQRLARDCMVCSSALEHGLCQGVEEKARHQDQSPGWMVTMSSIPRYPSNWLRMNTKVSNILLFPPCHGIPHHSGGVLETFGCVLPPRCYDILRNHEFPLFTPVSLRPPTIGRLIEPPSKYVPIHP